MLACALTQSLGLCEPAFGLVSRTQQCGGEDAGGAEETRGVAQGWACRRFQTQGDLEGALAVSRRQATRLGGAPPAQVCVMRRGSLGRLRFLVSTLRQHQEFLPMSCEPRCASRRFGSETLPYRTCGVVEGDSQLHWLFLVTQDLGDRHLPLSRDEAMQRDCDEEAAQDTNAAGTCTRPRRLAFPREDTLCPHSPTHTCGRITAGATHDERPRRVDMRHPADRQN